MLGRQIKKENLFIYTLTLVYTGRTKFLVTETNYSFIQVRLPQLETTFCLSAATDVRFRIPNQEEFDYQTIRNPN